MAGVTVVCQHRANSPFEKLNLLRGLLSTTRHRRSEDTTAKLHQAHLQIPLLLKALRSKPMKLRAYCKPTTFFGGGLATTREGPAGPPLGPAIRKRSPEIGCGIRNKL